MSELAALPEKPGPSGATWVASILFGLASLLLTIFINKLNAIETKVDTVSTQLPAVVERVEGVRDRLARVERTVYPQPWESRRE